MLGELHAVYDGEKGEKLDTEGLQALGKFATALRALRCRAFLCSTCYIYIEWLGGPRRALVGVPGKCCSPTVDEKLTKLRIPELLVCN